MLHKKTLLLFALVISLVFTACRKDDPPPISEEELITTLTYTLTSVNGEIVVLNFADLDGDGGDEPIISSGTLRSDQTYLGTLVLLNESETPSENITEEIAEEDEEHQFFFESNIAGLSFNYNDQDADGNPIGLSSTLITGSAGSGSITITLRHEPNKTAEGVSDGDIANAGGETDIEVTFQVDVE